LPRSYAGSVHCSRPSDASGWTGGSYFANTHGLPHYATTGYKCKKMERNRGSTGVLIDPTPDSDGKNGWAEIPFKYGRGIFHTGELPHQSGKVEYSEAKSGADLDQWGKTRVMVGINAFGWDIGPEVETAPEHSPAFNRQVKLVQAMAARESKGAKEGGGGGAEGGGGGGMGMEAIMGDKAMRKMLVLAKREKVKKEMAEERRKMEESVAQLLDGAGEEGVECGGLARAVVDALALAGGPSFDTVHVQVNLMWRQGKIALVEGEAGEDGMLRVDGSCRLARAAKGT
jgi:hypothetical protein